MKGGFILSQFWGLKAMVPAFLPALASSGEDLMVNGEW
jgi:hypothetical protein